MYTHFTIIVPIPIFTTFLKTLFTGQHKYKIIDSRVCINVGFVYLRHDIFFDKKKI